MQLEAATQQVEEKGGAEHTCGCISAIGTWRAVGTRMTVITQVVLRAGSLVASLVGLW
jgi:hypothetical protein